MGKHVKIICHTSEDGAEIEVTEAGFEPAQKTRIPNGKTADFTIPENGVLEVRVAPAAAPEAGAGEGAQREAGPGADHGGAGQGAA